MLYSPKGIYSRFVYGVERGFWMSCNPPSTEHEAASNETLTESPLLIHPPEGKKVLLSDSVLAWAKKVGRGTKTGSAPLFPASQ